MKSTYVFILLVLCYQNALCSKNVCDIEDYECTTEAVKKIRYVNTKLLHADVIEADLPTIKYTLTNVTLDGIIDCIPELLKINIKDMTFDYHLACKYLNMYGLYETNGELGPMHIEGKGEFSVDYHDYVFLFHGIFDQFVDENNKVHNHILNYKLDMNARGKVLYDFKNLFNGDNEKAAALLKFVHENGELVNEILRQPVMEKFMALLIDVINAYLAKVPVEDLLAKS